MRRNRIRCLTTSVVLVALSIACAAADEPQATVLWAEGAPGAIGTDDTDRPTLTIYQPPSDRRQPTAIVVCPGGGYGALALDHEGRQIAEWLNSLGVTVGVLKYRLAPRYHHPAPLQDAQRAVRTFKADAARLGIDPEKVGILGFSAGGHLASTVATHFDAGNAESPDAIERQSSRPAFAILGYPVIAMATEFAHGGSRKNLLGENPAPELLESMSNERQVTAETPPCFLVHTSEDTAVPPENSVLFYLALRKAGVPAELHVFERGRHGLGLGRDDPAFSTWPSHCATWLALHGWLKKEHAAD